MGFSVNKENRNEELSAFFGDLREFKKAEEKGIWFNAGAGESPNEYRKTGKYAFLKNVFVIMAYLILLLIFL